MDFAGDRRGGGGVYLRNQKSHSCMDLRDGVLARLPYIQEYIGHEGT